MKITFNPLNEDQALVVRDFINGLHCSSRGVIDSMENPVNPAEVDNRIDVPVIPDMVKETIVRAATPPAPPSPPITGPHDVPAGTVTTPPHDITMREIPGNPDVDPEAAAAPERDKHGRVWDERIDSGNRKQTTAGEWHARRNVDPAVRTAVMAELMAVAPSPEDTFAAADTPAPPATTPAPPATTPAPPVAEVAVDWNELFQRTMAAQIAGQLNQEQVDAKVAEYGIGGGFPGLIAHPDKWELFLMELNVA